MKSGEIKNKLENIGHDPNHNEFYNKEWIEKDQFMYELNGLIKGEFVNIETDSKEVLKEIIKIMD